MKNRFTILTTGILLFCVLIMSGCKKFLEEKSDISLSTPETLDDLQQMLDNTTLLRGTSMNNIATDEIYIQESIWRSIPEFYSKGYVWDANVQDEEDWINMYLSVYYANNVLDNLERLRNIGTAEQRGYIRGAALFYRAYALFNVLQVYATQYEQNIASAALGIPLRLNTNLNEISSRATLQESYDKVIGDLDESASLLPETSLNTGRPNRVSCKGLLARVYLQKGDYQNAKDAADYYLSRKQGLIDFKQVSATPLYPFGPFLTNMEIAFYATNAAGLTGVESVARIDTLLYRSYASNDLRKSLFFRLNADGSYFFRGKYSGTAALFVGVATDELYLIRAEANARLGKITEALADLNFLCAHRYDNSFVPYPGATTSQVLPIVLDERRKELFGRGLRWSDLRRLNKEPQFAITIKRILGNLSFELPPNDPRYTILIPQKILNQVSLPQNPR